MTIEGELKNNKTFWNISMSTPWGVISTLEDAYSGEQIATEPVNEDKMAVANERFGKYWENLPELDRKVAGQKDTWLKLWDKDERMYGKESLRTLFPRIIDRDVRIITRALHALAFHGKIETRSQLIDKSNDQLLGIKNIGTKSMEMIIHLKDLISAQRNSISGLE